MPQVMHGHGTIAKNLKIKEHLFDQQSFNTWLQWEKKLLPDPKYYRYLAFYPKQLVIASMVEALIDLIKLFDLVSIHKRQQPAYSEANPIHSKVKELITKMMNSRSTQDRIGAFVNEDFELFKKGIDSQKDSTEDRKEEFHNLMDKTYKGSYDLVSRFFKKRKDTKDYADAIEVIHKDLLKEPKRETHFPETRGTGKARERLSRVESV